MRAFVDLLPSSTTSASPDTARSGGSQGEVEEDDSAASAWASSSSSRGVMHRSRRRLDQENGIDYSSGEGDDVEELPSIDEDEEGASAAASRAQQRSATETVCSPVGECSVCPHNWRVMIEKEDENIEGEWESCKRYGRRIKRQCNVLFLGELGRCHMAVKRVRPNFVDY